jgi:hypothetical protein
MCIVSASPPPKQEKITKGTNIMSKFVSSTIAAKELSISSEYLRGMIPHWKYGIHYRDVRNPNATRAAWQYNLEEINKWFAIKPEKRS